MLSQHPVTTEYGNVRQQINQTIKAIKQLNLQTIILWPNADAGSEEISRSFRLLREEKNLILKKLDSLRIYLIQNILIY